MADFPIAPSSTENATVILWVVGFLFTSLTVVIAALWRQMCANAKDCREDNRLIRQEAIAERARIETLHETSGSREKRLTEVVERNTAALEALKDELGSGYHRAVRKHEGRQ